MYPIVSVVSPQDCARLVVKCRQPNCSQESRIEGVFRSEVNDTSMGGGGGRGGGRGRGRKGEREREVGGWALAFWLPIAPNNNDNSIY